MVRGEGWEEGISPSSAPLPSRQEADLTHLIPKSRPDLLCFPGAALLAADEGLGQLSHSDDLRASFPACHRWQRQGGGQLSHTHTLRTSLPTTLPPGSALPICPGEVQGRLPQVLQLVRGRASSPALMTSWSQLSSCLHGEGKYKGRGLSLAVPRHSRQEAATLMPSGPSHPQFPHLSPSLLC